MQLYFVKVKSMLNTELYILENVCIHISISNLYLYLYHL